MEKITAKPAGLCSPFHRKPGDDQENTHYCPGCGHGIIHKLIGEAMAEMGITDRTVLISPVGCSVFAYYYFACGNVQAPHGRAPAVATGITRANPDNLLISYQGDGDLAAIGTAEIIHAANRGEKMTVFFVNNAIYGMTGGQMAPTSFIGQKTATTPFGRSAENEGYPLRAAELIATLPAPVYVTRVSVHDIRHTMQTKKAIRRALEAQAAGKGFALVEILSSCPSGWKIQPRQIKRWMEEYMLPQFPIGVLKDEIDQRQGHHAVRRDYAPDEILRVLGLDDASAGTTAATPVDRLGILCAGFGGQGVLLLGQFLARIGMQHGLNVTWLPSYGPEMRGGTANCSVVLDRDPVGTPVVDDPQVLVAMNGPSFEKFAPLMRPGTVVVYNSSLVAETALPAGVRGIPVAASDLSRESGNDRSANVVMLGAVLETLGREGKTFDTHVVDEVLGEFFAKPEIREVNTRALAAGRAAAAG